MYRGGAAGVWAGESYKIFYDGNDRLWYGDRDAFSGG